MNQSRNLKDQSQLSHLEIFIFKPQFGQELSKLCQMVFNKVEEQLAAIQSSEDKEATQNQFSKLLQDFLAKLFLLQNEIVLLQPKEMKDAKDSKQQQADLTK